MSKEKIRKIHLIYGWVITALVLIMAAALVISCVSIYRSGERPFSREVIVGALHRLAVPGVVCLAAVIGGIVLHIVLPQTPEKPTAVRGDAEQLARYLSRHNDLPEDTRKQAEREIRLRKKFRFGAAGISILLSVYPMLYFSDASHFGITDLNADILRAVLVVLIPTAVVLFIVFLCAKLENASIRRQIQVYKESGTKPERTEKSERSSALIPVRCVILAAAAVFIFLGILNEGYVDVLGKAIKICTECIGLG